MKLLRLLFSISLLTHSKLDVFVEEAIIESVISVLDTTQRDRAKFF